MLVHKILIPMHDSLNYTTWTNMGNAFIALGTECILKKACGQSSICFIRQPFDITAITTLKKRLINPSIFAESDWFILFGAIFTKGFQKLYGDLFSNLLNNKRTKLVMIGVGGSAYDDEEISECRKVLKKYKPYILFTRDSFTYECYHDLAVYSYDGICPVFFSKDYYEGYPIPELYPYICFNFDSMLEPICDLLAYDEKDPRTWHKVGVKIKKNMLPIRYKRLTSFFRKFPQKSGSYNIVRLTQMPYAKLQLNLYSHPNLYSCPTPYGYLNIYMNTSLTLSDRVHACVPTLAFGNPARLFAVTKRALLFDRVGIKDINSSICKVDQKLLGNEKRNLINTLEEIYKEERSNKVHFD